MDDASIATGVEEARARTRLSPRESPPDVGGPTARFDIPAPLHALANTLTASRQMRATDMTVGVALLAATTRFHHPVSSVAVIGIEAIRLGLRRPSSVERSYDVHPEISRHRFALTVRKTF